MSTICADNFGFTPFRFYRFNHPMSSVAIRRSKHDGQARSVPLVFALAMSEVAVCTAASDCTHSPRWRCSSGCIRRRRVALCVIHCCISHVCRESYASRCVILGNSGCARHGEKGTWERTRDQSRVVARICIFYISSSVLSCYMSRLNSNPKTELFALFYSYL